MPAGAPGARGFLCMGDSPQAFAESGFSHPEAGTFFARDSSGFTIVEIALGPKASPVIG